MTQRLNLDILLEVWLTPNQDVSPFTLHNLLRWDKTCNFELHAGNLNNIAGLVNKFIEGGSHFFYMYIPGQFGTDLCEKFVKTLFDFSSICSSCSIELKLINCSFIQFEVCHLIDSFPCFAGISIVSFKFVIILGLFYILDRIVHFILQLLKITPITWIAYLQSLNFKTIISPIHCTVYIKFLSSGVIHGLLEAQTCLMQSGACRSHSSKNKASISATFHWDYLFPLDQPTVEPRCPDETHYEQNF